MSGRAAAATNLPKLLVAAVPLPRPRKAIGQPPAGGARFPPPSGGTVRRRVATRAPPDAHAPRTRDPRLSRIRTGDRDTSRSTGGVSSPPRSPRKRRYSARGERDDAGVRRLRGRGLTPHRPGGLHHHGRAEEHYRSDCTDTTSSARWRASPWSAASSSSASWRRLERRAPGRRRRDATT